MHTLSQIIADAIKPFDNHHLIIAYSGGVDSQVLLHLIAQAKQQGDLTQQITVCHVHHGLSQYADDWADFAKQQCQLYQLPLVIKKVVLENPQANIEAQARQARYQALAEISDKPSVVLTGHHSDDQAETFLLALKRGAGLKGLSSMQAETEFERLKLLRPLLTVSRAQIEDYAKAKLLTWIEDDSNQNLNFDRNFLRHQIMPKLTQKWPHFVDAIGRSAQHCQQGQQLLDEIAQQDLQAYSHDERSLLIAPMRLLSKARFNNLIRYFLAQHQLLMPSTQQLEQVYQQMFAQVDKVPAIKIGEFWLRRYQDGYYLTPTFAKIDDWRAHLVIDESVQQLPLPDGLGELGYQFYDDNARLNDDFVFIKAPNAKQKVSIRFCHQNPTCLPDYRQQSRPLKKVLQELHIPTWQRQRIPFLYYDEEFVAAIGYFVCKSYLPVQGERQLQLLWHKGKNAC